MDHVSNKWFGRYAVLILGCALWNTLAVAKDKVRPSVVLDQDYVSALATANHFLHDWQIGDQENGIVMLTDGVKQHASEDRLEDFFSSTAGAAYEVGRGKKLQSGRYTFPIALFGSSKSRGIQPHYSRIVVVRIGRNEWAIDKLP
jgi:hypothetical protein